MKVITLIYHQRSIITTISTFLSVRPATCMDWKSRFCLNFGKFFFSIAISSKKFYWTPQFFFLNYSKHQYICLKKAPPTQNFWGDF